MTSSVYRWAIALLALLLSVAIESAFGAYPERPIRLLVGYPAGGGADFAARLVGAELGTQMGQQVIVDNRPGANGVIAAALVAKSAADGYTLLLIPFNFALSAALTTNLPFDPVGDFSAVTLIAAAPMVLTVNPSLPVKSVSELVRLAKRHPGSINYGSSGNGGTSHIAAELLKSLAAINLEHVPYRGAAPAMIGTITGEVSVYFGSMPPVLPHMRSGKLRVLGVTTSRRAKAALEIPTISEGGVPGYEFATWYGLVAPAKTPRSIVLLLHTQIAKALSRSSVQVRLLNDGAEPIGSDPGTFQKHLADEISKWKALVKSAGITSD